VVIVAAAGGQDLLQHCLKSLERYPLAIGRCRTWVIDNATRDGTASMVKSEFPWVSLVSLPRTVGFATANNLALAQTTSPFALLLNPDTELCDGALDHAVAALFERPEVAVLGVRLVRRDGSFDHAAKRSFPTILGAFGHFTGLGRASTARGVFAQYRAPEVDELGEGEVDAVNGAFMLVRRSAMDQVGLLDPGYRLYGEDLDWCYRFKAAGWTVWYDGGTTVVHVKGASTVRERGARRHRDLRVNFAFHHAMGRFYRKFRAGRNPLLDVVVYLGLTVKFVLSALSSAIGRRSLS
jgi:GT2 family glycosyltransferase